MENSCWHCHKKLPVLKRLAGELFCSAEHEEEYLREQSALAVARLTDPAMSGSGRPVARPVPEPRPEAREEAPAPEKVRAVEEEVHAVRQEVHQEDPLEVQEEIFQVAAHIREELSAVDLAMPWHGSAEAIECALDLVHPQFQAVVGAGLRESGPLRQVSAMVPRVPAAGPDRAEALPGHAAVEYPVNRAGLGQVLACAELLPFLPAAVSGVPALTLGAASQTVTGAPELSLPALRVTNRESREGFRAASYGYLGIERNLLAGAAGQLALERETGGGVVNPQIPGWGATKPALDFWPPSIGLMGASLMPAGVVAGRPESMASGAAKIRTRPIRETVLPVWEQQPNLGVLEGFQESLMALAPLVGVAHGGFSGAPQESSSSAGGETRLPDADACLFAQVLPTQVVPKGRIGFLPVAAGMEAPKALALAPPVGAALRPEWRAVPVERAVLRSFPQGGTVSTVTNRPSDQEVPSFEMVRPARGTRQARIASTTFTLFPPVLGTQDGIREVPAAAEHFHDPRTLEQMGPRRRSHLTLGADAPAVALSARLMAHAVGEPAAEGANAVTASSVPEVNMGASAAGAGRVRGPHEHALAEAAPSVAGGLYWNPAMALAGASMQARGGQEEAIAAVDLRPPLRLHPSSLLVMPTTAALVKSSGLACCPPQATAFPPQDSGGAQWGEWKS